MDGMGGKMYKLISNIYYTRKHLPASTTLRIMIQHVNTRCRNTISKCMQVLYLQQSWYIGKFQSLTLHWTQDPCRTEPWLLEERVAIFNTHSASLAVWRDTSMLTVNFGSIFQLILCPCESTKCWNMLLLRRKKQTVNECQWLQTILGNPPSKEQIHGFLPAQFTIQRGP